MRENRDLKAELAAGGTRLEQYERMFFKLDEGLEEAETALLGVLGDFRRRTDRIEDVKDGINRIVDSLRNSEDERRVLQGSKANTEIMVKELHKRLGSKDRVVQQL